MGGGQSQPDGTEPELLNFGQNSIEEINELMKTHNKKNMENQIRAYNSKREESKRDNAEHLKRKANRDKLRKEKAADVSDDTDDETLKSMQILPEKSDSEFQKEIDDNTELLTKKAGYQFTYKKLVAGLKAGTFKKIVVCTGAGISVSAGIPDFRSPDVGLYDNLEKMGYKLPSPQSIFTLDYFNEQPEAFYKLANDFLDCTKFDPTPTHHFIKLLQDKGILQFNLTQNIDNLEEKTGLDMENRVRQAHGANRGGHCGVCKEKMDAKVLAEHITKGEVMRCTKDGCKGPVKPDITFFGEGLPPSFFEAWDKMQDKPMKEDDEDPESERKYKDGGCDLMIVIGTALAVGPFNQSVNKIQDRVPCVLFNMEDDVPRENGFDFRDMENKPGRMYVQGKCDETLTKLCRDVGWIKEFIAVNPERMAKAGITLEAPKKQEEEKKQGKAPKQLDPKAKVPVKGGKLSPNAAGAKKAVPAVGAKKAVNSPNAAKKGASPNKGVAAKKPAVKK